MVIALVELEYFSIFPSPGSSLTRLIAYGPNQEIHARGIGHHIDLVLVDHRNAVLLAPLPLLVLLLVLQLRLPVEEQPLDELLHVLGERRGQVHLMLQQLPQQGDQHQVQRLREALVAIALDLVQREDVAGLLVQVFQRVLGEQLLGHREDGLQMLDGKRRHPIQGPGTGLGRRFAHPHIGELIKAGAVAREEVRPRIVGHGEVAVQQRLVLPRGVALACIVVVAMVLGLRQAAGHRARYYGSELMCGRQAFAAAKGSAASPTGTAAGTGTITSPSPLDGQ